MMLIRRSAAGAGPAARTRAGMPPVAAKPANTRIAIAVKETRQGAKGRDTPRIIAGGARAGHSA